MGRYPLELFGLILLISSVTPPAFPASDAPESAQTILSSFDLTAEQPVFPVPPVQAPQSPSGHTVPAPKAAVTSPPQAPPTARQAATEPPRNRAPERSLASLLGLNERRYHSDRLYSTPNMFGDSFFSRGQILGLTPSTHGGIIDIPGVQRAKIAENNSPLPRDRAYFTYQHFHNAIRAEDFSWEVPGYAFRQVDFSVNRYVVGFERAFLDNLFSADIRIPFQDTTWFNASPWPPFPGVNDFLFTARTDSGSLGNISVTVKGLLHESERCAISAGLMVDVPTGPSVSGEMYFMPYRLENESVHLGPFVGALYRPGDNWFCQGFLQVDVDLNGNSFHVNDWTDTPIEVGVVQDQTLLYVDLSVGRWLLRRPRSSFLTGVAGLLEFHYTTTLENADLVTASWPPPGLLQVGNSFGHVDITNLTAGLHFQCRRGLDLRVAAVAPLQSSDSDRSFDFELVAQVNWAF